MPRKTLYDLKLSLHGETDKALKVSETGEASKAVWLPKSQIEYETDQDGFHVICSVPEWLCIEKGFSGF